MKIFEIFKTKQKNKEFNIATLLKKATLENTKVYTQFLIKDGVTVNKCLIDHLAIIGYIHPETAEIYQKQEFKLIHK